MIKNSKVDTALHVIKGAAQKILGTTLTTGVYEDGNKGRLTIECHKKPADEEIVNIEEEANNKIREDVPVETFEMDRKEAEDKFGSIIYDKFPVPSHISRLKIVNIQDWNTNCCIGSHVDSTGKLGNIRILKTDFRNSKKQLEISFLVE